MGKPELPELIAKTNESIIKGAEQKYGKSWKALTKKQRPKLMDTLKYIEENGFSSVDAIATETGITQKNVTRYLEYQNIANEPDMKSQKFTGSGIVLN